MNSASAVINHTIFSIDQNSAFDQLCEIHEKAFLRAKNGAGSESIIPLCDVSLNKGKPELVRHYIERTKGVRLRHRSAALQETLSKCHTVHITFSKAAFQGKVSFEAAMLWHLQSALVPLFVTPPLCLFRSFPTTGHFLSEFREVAGPIFIALDKICHAFDIEGVGDIQRREMFNSFCESILAAWLRVQGVFFLVLAEESFIRLITCDPLDSAALSQHRPTSLIFRRLGARNGD
jgi:hypothetical protein